DAEIAQTALTFVHLGDRSRALEAGLQLPVPVRVFPLLPEPAARLTSRSNAWWPSLHAPGAGAFHFPPWFLLSHRFLRKTGIHFSARCLPAKPGAMSSSLKIASWNINS